MRTVALVAAVLTSLGLGACRTTITPRPDAAPPTSRLVCCDVVQPDPRSLDTPDLQRVLVAEEAAERFAECEEDPCACPPVNKVNVFLGYSTSRGGGGGQTLGIDYEHRFGRQWGVAAYGEYVAGDLEAFVMGVGVVFHPSKGFFLLAGPGLELEDGEWDRIFRFGFGWDVEIYRGWSFSPSVYFDATGDGDGVAVFGFNIGKDF